MKSLETLRVDYPNLRFRIQAHAGRTAALGALLLLLLTVASRQTPSLRAGSPRDGTSQDKLAVDQRIYLPSVFMQESQSTSPLFGVNFISSAEDPADAQQYRNGKSTGAAWNRWPIYWFNVEKSPGNFAWSAQDANVAADLGQGLKIDAILLGTPSFYTTRIQPPDLDRPEQLGMFTVEEVQAAKPVGLDEPVFADGTDLPGTGKGINDANTWARFVFATVSRYMPGGQLALANNWPEGVGITHWEMWNEPDLGWFWNSSLADYARLLKVGYLAAKQADPEATVLFAGLANNFEYLSFYDEVLDIYDADPLAGNFDHFHDILATHSYFYAWQSWYHVYRARTTMAEHGLNKPIWLNETGVPAWNDYPGPVWDPESALRATMSEQADYVIQSAFYAVFAGAEAYFHFQLYDGCGNQPRGTDFPPHDGSLCGDPNYPYCAGDANGLFRNPTDAACFTQHPNPETPRPNFEAYKVLADLLVDVEPLWRLRPGGPNPYEGPQEWIALYQPASGTRILGLWTRYGEDQLAVVPATGGSALLVGPDGNAVTITPQAGNYSLSLPAATNQNAPWDPTLYAIGGRPTILLERDTLAPEVTASAEVTAGGISVEWSGDDKLGSGIADFDVLVSVDGGPSQVWLQQTTKIAADYPAEAGHNYVFSIVARDRAGNVSPAATTSISAGDGASMSYLPVVMRS